MPSGWLSFTRAYAEVEVAELQALDDAANLLFGLPLTKSHRLTGNGSRVTISASKAPSRDDHAPLLSVVRRSKLAGGAAKKVKRASEQTPDFRHRGKTSGGGHFQGASIFWEKQALLATVFRLISDPSPRPRSGDEVAAEAGRSAALKHDQ